MWRGVGLASLGPLLALMLAGCAADDELPFGPVAITSTGGGAGRGGAGGTGAAGGAGHSGATVHGVPNVDDDDEDGQADWLQPPFGADDDLSSWSAPAERLDALAGLATIQLELAGDVDTVRLWRDGALMLGKEGDAEPVTVQVLAAADARAELVVEFGDFRREATLTVVARDDADGEMDRFEVTLQSAPLLIHHHLQPTERVYGVQNGSTGAVMAGLASAAGDAFVGVDNFDIWIQDELQWAAVTAPGMRLDVAMDSIRDRELDDFVKSLKAPDVQPMTWGPDGAATTEDKFGNLEVTPPHAAGGTDYPYGRIYYGAKGDIGPHEELTSFLAEQEVQAPLALDTSWLCIGHVDEFVTFVPAPSAAKGFVMLFADVYAAYDLLESLPTSTSLPRYGVSHGYDTVGSILADQALRTLNEDLQTDHLDPILAQLTMELELDGSDVVHVPALFERYGNCPYGTEPIEAVALIPALVNLAVITRPDEPVRLVVPDPFLRSSATPQSSDPLVQRFASLMPTEVEITFVDDWFSYHVGAGEVHCGSSVARTPDGAEAASARRAGSWAPPAAELEPKRGASTMAALGVEDLPPPIRTRAGTLRFVDPSLRGSDRARDRLLAALDETAPASLRAAIVEALPRTSPGWEPALLRQLERDPDATVRKLCAASLRFGAEPARVAGVRRGLRDPAAAVRAEAALLASHVSAAALRSTDLAERLLALLDDQDRRPRAMAARTLGLAELDQARAPLARLARDPAPTVRREAARALTRLE